MVEAVVVLALVGILATLIIPAVGPTRDRVEKVACMGNLRAIHVSLGAVLIDNKRWPQVPEEAERAQMEQFWIDTLEPYGVSGNVWLCPSLKRRYNEDPDSFVDYPRIHYIPGQFDDNPGTPRRWSAQPWVMEVGSMHGRGNLLIRTDGGIRELQDLFEDFQRKASQ